MLDLFIGTQYTDIPQQHRFRSDVVQALRDLPVPRSEPSHI